MSYAAAATLQVPAQRAASVRVYAAPRVTYTLRVAPAAAPSLADFAHLYAADTARADAVVRRLALAQRIAGRAMLGAASLAGFALMISHLA